MLNSTPPWYVEVQEPKQTIERKRKFVKTVASVESLVMPQHGGTCTPCADLPLIGRRQLCFNNDGTCYSQDC